MFLPAEAVPALEADPNIDVYRKASNFSYVLRMRSDEGRPAHDNRVRQALKAGTDRKAMLEGAVGGLGVVGRDTPIGPAFGEFFLNVPEFEVDIERAKELLAEAGFADGLDITIHTQQDSPVPAMATIWREQMAEIGVNVDIQLVPTEIYYSDLWMDVDFGFTDWGPRPYPQPYLDLAYITGAPWNESHWSNPRLDELAAQAASEMDHAARVQLYHQIQEIFIEEGPIILPFFLDNLYATRSNVGGVVPNFGMSLDLRYFYFTD
jgi:peptide/nickel transport system substrate-binding protein